ncbi:hypothetical protein ONS96_003014 [Cadophora gregata f. sp. sojae]|nr:hypothetical protein ONS96_003014 [Cadophora gregata f. sp. sojae]
MAEVLGVVASGIAVTQLAGQVAKSVIKLKECWDQVQEAPADIKYLLREIDSLNLILNHIQEGQTKQEKPDCQCIIFAYNRVFPCAKKVPMSYVGWPMNWPRRLIRRYGG